jgi:hypothetical protein
MADDFIDRLSSSSSLTDILIQMESFIDDLDTYAFKNWFEGELVDGPNVERHWVSMTLQYDYNQMPDPDGGIRLLKYGAIVIFKKAKKEDTESHKQEDIRNINSQYSYTNNGNNRIDDILSRQKPQLKTVWLVTIKIPRHFIDELEQMDDMLDDGIDTEHVQAARDSDLQAKDAYSDDTMQPEDPMQPNTQGTQDEMTGEMNQQATGAV